MPNRRDKLPGPRFPSELNPLTNPTLEQNLGRWARVYFGNPPAQRQQAVGKLLQEIQRETGTDPVDQAVRPYFARDEKFQGAVCSACRHQNPPSHKFCSRCGQVLNPVRSAATDNLSATGVSEAPPSPPRSENDVQWMRDQAFSGLDGPHTPHRQGWKYLAGAFVLVLAGFAYLQWAPRPRTGVGSSPTSPQVSAPAASLPQNSSPAEIQSTRNDFAGIQRARGSGYRNRRGSRSPSRAGRSSAGLPEISVTQRPTVATGPGSRGGRRLRSAARPALSRRQHGRAGFLRSRETIVEGGQQTERRRSGAVVGPLFARRRRSPQLRSGASSPRCRLQAGSPAGSSTLARSGIAGLPLRKPANDRKAEDPRITRVFGCAMASESDADSALKMIAAKSWLMETENILLPAFQNLRRAPGPAGGGLRTREPTRRGSRARACRR